VADEEGPEKQVLQLALEPKRVSETLQTEVQLQTRLQPELSTKTVQPPELPLHRSKSGMRRPHGSPPGQRLLQHLQARQSQPIYLLSGYYSQETQQRR